MERVGGRHDIADSDERRSDAEREEAFALLIDGELDRSFRLARLILRSDADAEDVIQDAVVSAWRHWRDLRERDRFDAWFGRIVVNRCRDRLRTSGRSLQLEATGWQGFANGSELDGLEHRLDLSRAFETLNADQRITVVLRYWRDLTVDEIARRTGVPAGTVKSRLHSALGRMRSSLEQTEVIE